MDALLMSDTRNNVSLWDIPVLYGECGDIFVHETDKRAEKDLDQPLKEFPSAKDSGVVAALRFLKDQEQKRSIGLQRARRETLPVLHVKGSFYEVGFRIGRTFSSLIRDYVESNRDVQFALKLYETPKGKEVFCSCFDAVSRMYPEYIRELRGLSDGSKIPFPTLFLMHMEDVMLVALSPKEEKPIPLTGSTTLVVTNDNVQTLGHVVDQSSVALGNAYLISAQITECSPEQEFTALCIGGMLPGNNMGFNAHGLVFVADPVSVRKCNECGVPRSILCRAALSAPNLTKLSNILRCSGTGIANGLSITVSSLRLRVFLRTFRCYELGPRFPAHSESSIAFRDIRPPKEYSFYHVNKYQFLSTVQEKIHPQCAKWMLSKVNTLMSFKENTLGERVPQVLGDSSINSLALTNIYTSVESEGMLSVAVGIFDFIEETWSIYFDNPSETQPIIVLPVIVKELGIIMNPNVF
ncbi:hypothetical protein GE061_005674 [Apolygus lucorum]|uniref:Peptidase C45 hydrolase domain-containing protein n=1 Tax=Apolygus lucorum TaxID=248454 RepID=A0A6A4IUU2_APOLU|nr:hypothetical protein GE061_005674 [Apolygus lucorum]